MSLVTQSELISYWMTYVQIASLNLSLFFFSVGL